LTRRAPIRKESPQKKQINYLHRLLKVACMKRDHARCVMCGRTQTNDILDVSDVAKTSSGSGTLWLTDRSGEKIDLSKANPGTAAVFMALGSFSFVGIGVIAAILPLLYVERGAQMTFVLQSCLLLVSGVYYSVTILPGWMQVLSKFSPATYVLDGVRKGIVGGTPVTELWYDIWPLILLGLVYIPFGLWAFGRAEHYAKRTGKLKRVG
jgi:hypothetical protein